jgi:hypothetical protein
MSEQTDNDSLTTRAIDVSALEDAILKNDTETARARLREMLFILGGLDSGSIGDALAHLAQEPIKHRAAAIVLLRCIPVQGLLPEANSINRIIRSTVELCDGALPGIASFLKISIRAQNIDKFLLYEGFHARVVELLSPLQVPYGDLSALLTSRKDILGCLNHSIVRQYGSLFMLKETRRTIESIFGKHWRVAE